MGAFDTSLIRRHRLTLDEYHRMAEAGVLAPDARVELIEGEVIDMAPIGSRHASVVKRLNRILVSAVGGRAIVSVQDPIQLSTRSEPKPDIALLQPSDDYYAKALPAAADCLLVIEVADTTSAYDRQIKSPLYARHGVPELWIVDLDMRVLRLCRRPEAEGYADITASEVPGLTPLPSLPGVSVDLTGILAL
jgi:Uma2 family endonuclease